MIKLAIRLHRTELLIAGMVATLLGGWLLRLTSEVIDGLAAVGRCLTSIVDVCGSANFSFYSSPAGDAFVSTWPFYALLLFPLLAGAMLAAPATASEFEKGTYEFTWTQNGGREKWFVAQLIVLAAPLCAIAAVLSILATRLQDAKGPLGATLFMWQWFDVSGAVAIGYMGFATALGLLVGALLRRTLPAMALTAFIYAGVRYGVWVLRSHFLPPIVHIGGMNESAHMGDGRWLLGQRYLDSSGSPVPLGSHQIRSLELVFHRADRFPVFQAIEMAIFVVLAVLAGVMTIWVIRRFRM